MFELSISPGEVLSWERFIAEKSPYAIAMDGYVTGPPRCEMSGPWVNLNHHEGVNRLATRATCEQVMVSIRMGLLEGFTQAGKPKGTLYVNDVDEDVCLSTWLFRHHHQLESSRSELIHRLVYVEGLLDTTAGAYPLPLESAELQELGWVFKPFHDKFREQDGSGLDAKARAAVVDEVGRHISLYVRGRAERVEMDVRYHVLGGGPGWAMVRESGVHARTAMRAHGIRAFVAVRPRNGGGHEYTLARMSPYVVFPVARLFELLNEAEGIGPEDTDRWAGGDTVGGSPRRGGSRFDPETLQEVLNDALARIEREAHA